MHLRLDVNRLPCFLTAYGRVARGYPDPIPGRFLAARLWHGAVVVGSVVTVGLLAYAGVPGRDAAARGVLILLPYVSIVLAPLAFRRDFEVWDLIAWARRPFPPRGSAASPSSVDLSSFDASIRPSVLARDVTAMRAALAAYPAETPLGRAYVLYYEGRADLMSGDRPDVVRLQEVVDGLDPERRARLGVLVALLQAGIANQDGRDWREPLLAMRDRLHLRLSIWRALWPMRRFAIGGLVVWSILCWVVV